MRASEAVGLLLLLNPSPLGASVRLEAEAALEREAPDYIVRIGLKNAGDTDASRLVVSGQLLGETETVSLGELKAGASALAHLRFAARGPGTHGLVLRLSYPPSPNGTDLLESLYCLPVGNEGKEVIRAKSPSLALETASPWPIQVESVDGRAHEFHLWVAVPKGLGVDPWELRARVGDKGALRLAPTLFRGAIPHNETVEAWIVLEDDEPGSRAVIQRAEVKILPDPALLPKIRLALAALFLALLATTLVLEIWSIRRREVDRGRASPRPEEP